MNRPHKNSTAANMNPHNSTTANKHQKQIVRRIHTITNQLSSSPSSPPPTTSLTHSPTRQFHYQKTPTTQTQTHNHSMVQQERQVKRVLVTGAAGQICYSLLPMIASGRMLGEDQPVILHLLEIPVAMDALRGVVMELEDCAYPLLRGIVPTSNAKEAFTDVDVAVLVGAFPRKVGMERKDLLEKNVGIFKVQGKALNDYAKRDVKVVVVGNPANTNCLIAKHYAPNIPAENFSALTRLDHNRTRAQIALRAHVPVNSVRDVIIWGNHSSTQYPDVNHGYIMANGARKPIREVIRDNEWLNGAFVSTVQKRGAAIIAARKLSSAASAANAIVDHIHDWVLGSREGEIVSMAVPSDGSYGVAPGVIYSYPVTTRNGKYTIVQGLKIDDFSRSKMTATDKELREEKEIAMSIIQ